MNYDHDLHQVLYNYCTQYQPDSYLEIGVREGDSLIVVLGACKPDRITLCDSWGVGYGGTGRGNHDHIVTLLNRLNVNTSTFNFVDGDSHNTIKTIKEEFKFVMVDGDHSEEGARQDLTEAWPLVKPGGILFMDDLWHTAHPYILGIVEKFSADTPNCSTEYFRRPNRFGCAIMRKKLI